MPGPRNTPLASIAALAATAVSILATVSPALAQSTTCDAGGMMGPNLDQLDNFPASTESGTPVDPFVRIRYVDRPPPRPFIHVSLAAQGSPLLPGTVNVIGNEVHWHGETDLLPNTTYEVAFTVLAGNGSSFQFTTGSAHSIDWATAAATSHGDGGTGGFEGLLPETQANDNVSAERAGATDQCGDPDAINVTLNWHNPPDTHWPVQDIEFVVYETRGPGIGGPVERTRVRGREDMHTCAGDYEQCWTLRLTPEEASGPVCFNIQALDPYGRADGNTNEHCFKPPQGAAFVGCSATPASVPGESGTGSRGAWAVVAVGALAVTTALGVRGRRRAPH